MIAMGARLPDLTYRRSLVGLGAFVVTACHPGPPAWCDAVPGTTRIIIDRPIASRRALRLRPIWEARPGPGGGLRGPSAIAVDSASGMLAIADHVTGSIDVIAPIGTAVAHWSQRGRGPGQLSFPAALDWTPDGALAVLDPDLRKIVRLDSAGRVVAEFPLAPALMGNVPDWWVFLQGSDIVGVPSPRLMSTMPTRAIDMVLLRARSFGAGIDTIIAMAVWVSQGGGLSPSIVPGSAVPVAAPLGDGLLAVGGDTPQFRIRILGPDDQVLRVICQITPALPLSDGETRLAAELGAAEPVSNLARIGRLFSDGEGRIWAQRDRVSGVYLQDRWFGPPGATFDVLDRSGAYLGEVRAPDDTRLAAAHGNTVIGLRSDSVGAVSVVAFWLAQPSVGPHR